MSEASGAEVKTKPEDFDDLGKGKSGEGPVDQADGATGQTPLKSPYTTGITEITYPCGCKAVDPEGNLPEHCPDHPEQRIEKFVDRHGTMFEPGVHAVQPHDGSPKLDSAGKLIRIEHDYAGPQGQKYHGS
jgi:hypothetical protein